MNIISLIKSKKEAILNWLYMSHVFVVWAGGAYQVFHVFQSKSAQDVTLVWILCLLYADIAALPRCCHSEYFVWKLCHIGGALITVILAIGVILYG